MAKSKTGNKAMAAANANKEHRAVVKKVTKSRRKLLAKNVKKAKNRLARTTRAAEASLTSAMSAVRGYEEAHALKINRVPVHLTCSTEESNV